MNQPSTLAAKESESDEAKSDFESELNDMRHFKTKLKSKGIVDLEDKLLTEAYGDIIFLARKYNGDVMVERDMLKTELALQHERMERVKAMLESAMQDLCPAIDRIALLRASLESQNPLKRRI